MIQQNTVPVRIISGIAKYAFLIFFTAIAVGPIIWAFISSFKTYAEINSSAFSLPSRFDFKLKIVIVLLISASLMLPSQAICQPLFF